jgi:hypothetical protein
MTTTLFDAGFHAATNATRPMTLSYARHKARTATDPQRVYWNGYVAGLRHRARPNPEGTP